LVREVLHATFEHHAYPAHVHEDWTVLLIDDGAVSYQLGRSTHQAVPGSITLLPPDVPHDGRSAVSGQPFRKRVLYLDRTWLPAETTRAAYARPSLQDPGALATLVHLHGALQSPGAAMVAEHGVLTLREMVRSHLGTPASTARDVPLARRLRELLDAHLTEPFTIAGAAQILTVHPSHLVRSFTNAYGIAPHRYLTGRRVDYARRLLLQGHSPANAAVQAGFYDQAHLTRHFRRVLGTTPGAFVA